MTRCPSARDGEGGDDGDEEEVGLEEGQGPGEEGALEAGEAEGLGREGGGTRSQEADGKQDTQARQGRPLLIRFRQFPATFAKENYPQRINVTWTMADAASTGLPTDAEQAQLVAFEDRLVAAVEHAAHSALSVVLTCDGKREWVFHTADVTGFDDASDRQHHRLPASASLVLRSAYRSRRGSDTPPGCISRSRHASTL